MKKARKKAVKLRKSKAKAVVVQIPREPEKIDAADVMSYQISSVIRDRKHRTTHAKIGGNIFSIQTLYQLHTESGYRFYTSDDGIIKRDVLLITKKSGKYYFATEADLKKENNLDYLPTAKLV